VKIGCGFDWNRPEYYHRVKRVILWDTNEDRVREDSSHQGFNDVYINTHRRFGGAFGLQLQDLSNM
jgi:hypothetical protein